MQHLEALPFSKGARSLVAIVLTIGAMFVLAALDTSSKYLSQAYSPFQILWTRYICFLGIVCFTYRGQLRGAIASAHLPLQIARSVVLLVETVAFIASFKLFPLADVHAVGAICPILTTCLAIAFLRESVPRGMPLALGLGFAGVILVLQPQLSLARWEIAIAVGGSILWSIYQILTRVAGKIDAPVATAVFTPFVGLVLTMPLIPFVWVAPSAGDWLILVGSGFLGTLAHYCIILSLRFADAVVVQPFNFTIFLWAVMFGSVFFGDIPSPLTWVGVALIACGSAFALRQGIRRKIGDDQRASNASA